MHESLTVDILLATHNGALYLPEQLFTIDRQTCPPLNVLVADDGSTDDSLRIIDAWAGTTRHSVRIIATNRVGSACANFSRLMEASASDYVFFADQDDYWEPNKVEALIAACPPPAHKKPVLVHSDMAVIDARGRVLRHSHFSALRTDPLRSRPAQVCLKNIASGNATMITRPLLRSVLPVPTWVKNHDWWIAAVAAAIAQVKFVPEPLVRYRQHDANVEGSKYNRVSRISGEFRLLRQRYDYRHKSLMALELLHRFDTRLNPSDRQQLRGLAQLPFLGPVQRRFNIARHHLWHGDLLRDAYFLAKS